MILRKLEPSEAHSTCIIVCQPVKLVPSDEPLEGAVHHAGQEVALAHIAHEPHRGGSGGGREGGQQARDQSEGHQDHHGVWDGRGIEIY